MKLFGKAAIYTMLLLFATGCTIDKIDSWDAHKGFVWFTTNDTLGFTFAAHLDSSFYTIQLPVTLAGSAVGYDRSVNVSIFSQVRNDSTKFEILHPVVIPADSTSGYVKVRIQKTDNLNYARDTFSLRISSSDHLKAGLVDYRDKTVILYNRFVRPVWWDLKTEHWIGRYTELKLYILYQALGEVTEDPVPLDNGAIRTLNVYKLNHYVELYGPFYDYDGTTVHFWWD